MSRLLYSCQKCAEEVGEGEDNNGRHPYCGGELDPIGETEDATMSNHNESKLPKWAQRELGCLRARIDQLGGFDEVVRGDRLASENKQLKEELEAASDIITQIIMLPVAIQSRHNGDPINVDTIMEYIQEIRKEAALLVFKGQKR